MRTLEVMREDLDRLVGEFLAERRESRGGWAPVTLEDKGQLSGILELLIRLKWGADPDGDRPVQYQLVDRTKYYPVQYLPVPYWYGEGPYGEGGGDASEALRVLLANLMCAADEVRTFLACNRDLKLVEDGEEGADG